MFATGFAEATGTMGLGKSSRFLYGVQGFFQSAVGNGGYPDPKKAYTLPGEKTHGVGLRSGIQWGHHQLTVNYLGISDEGRFLFPREWGREQLFASMRRERLEGMGGVNAITVLYDKTFIHDKLKVSFGAGHMTTPNLEEVQLNKYSLPHHYHFIGLIDYRFDEFFQGLDLQFL